LRFDNCVFIICASLWTRAAKLGTTSDPPNPHAMKLLPKPVDLLPSRRPALLPAGADGVNAVAALAAPHGAPPGAPVS
jgi:hypothetical protein